MINWIVNPYNRGKIAMPAGIPSFIARNLVSGAKPVYTSEDLADILSAKLSDVQVYVENVTVEWSQERGEFVFQFDRDCIGLGTDFFGPDVVQMQSFLSLPRAPETMRRIEGTLNFYNHQWSLDSYNQH